MNGISKGFDGIELKDYFIAYFDILGYRDRVENKSDEEVKKFIYDIRGAIHLSKDMLRVFAEKENMQVNFKVFSDNFIFYTENDYHALLMYTSVLQAALALFEIFVRGVLCHGSMYCDKDFIAGEGLIKAYDLEVQEKNPRIIVDSSFASGVARTDKKKLVSVGNPNPCVTVTSVNNKLEEEGCVYKDDDGKLYLNYLNEIKQYKEIEKKSHQRKPDFIEILQSHKDCVMNNIAENQIDESVLKKYLWCRNYHNRFCCDNDFRDYMIAPPIFR